MREMDGVVDGDGRVHVHEVGLLRKRTGQPSCLTGTAYSPHRALLVLKVRPFAYHAPMRIHIVSVLALALAATSLTGCKKILKTEKIEAAAKDHLKKAAGWDAT